MGIFLLITLFTSISAMDNNNNTFRGRSISRAECIESECAQFKVCFVGIMQGYALCKGDKTPADFFAMLDESHFAEFSFSLVDIRKSLFYVKSFQDRLNVVYSEEFLASKNGSDAWKKVIDTFKHTLLTDILLHSKNSPFKMRKRMFEQD
jgi:hypothetical protein